MPNINIFHYSAHRYMLIPSLAYQTTLPYVLYLSNRHVLPLLSFLKNTGTITIDDAHFAELKKHLAELKKCQRKLQAEQLWVSVLYDRANPYQTSSPL
jgi:hypothetical protein